MGNSNDASAKIKILTISLFMTSCIYTTNLLAEEYIAKTPAGKKVEAYAQAIPDFLQDYAPYKQFIEGAYSAKGGEEFQVAVGTSFATVRVKTLPGQAELNQNRIKELSKDADIITSKDNIQSVTDVLNISDSNNNTAVKEWHAFLQDPDGSSEILVDMSSYSDLKSKIKSSSQSTTRQDVILIENIDEGIANFYKNCNAVSVQVFGDKDTNNKAKAFFEYAAAYQDYLKQREQELSKFDDYSKTNNNPECLKASTICNQSDEIKYLTKEQVRGIYPEFSKIYTDEELRNLKLGDAKKKIDEINNLFAKAKQLLINEAKHNNKQTAQEQGTKTIRALGRANEIPATKLSMQNISERQLTLVSGVNSGNVFNNSNVWMRPGYFYSKVQKIDDEAEFTQNASGLTIGLDTEINNFFEVGICYSYFDETLKVKDDSKQKDNDKSHGAGIYAVARNNNIFIDGQFNYIKNKIKGKKLDNNKLLTYQHDGEVFNAVVGITKNFELNNRWYAKPRLFFAFSNYSNDEYNELNSDNDTLYTINEKDYKSEELGLQFIIGKNIKDSQNNRQYHPQLTLSFVYDLKVDSDQIPYKNYNNGPKRDQANFNIGLGTDVIFSYVTVNLNYNLSWSKHTQEHVATIKFSYLF